MIRLRLTYDKDILKPTVYDVSNFEISKHRRNNNKFIVQHERNTLNFGPDVTGFQILVRRKIDFSALSNHHWTNSKDDLEIYGGVISKYRDLYDDKLPDVNGRPAVPVARRTRSHGDPQFLCFSPSVLYTNENSTLKSTKKYTLPTFMICETLYDLEESVDFQLIFYSNSSNKPYDMIIANPDNKYIDLVLVRS